MPPLMSSRHPTLLQTYQERASLSNTSPLASYLLRLIAAKKTNLCVSADVTSTTELLILAEEVGDHICLLKTHADIIQDFGHKTIEGLQSLAKRKKFLIFEDRKFGDIGSTVQKQYTAGPLQIVRWANIINAHIFPGPAIVTALASAAEDAVTAYSTAVETHISGPPADSYDGCTEEPDVSEAVPSPSPEVDQDGDRLSSDDETDNDNGEADEAQDELGLQPTLSAQRSSSPDRSARKLSVVSVSTTISTKTESITPQRAPLHHRGMSASSNPTTTTEDTGAVLSTLGAPPMARSLLLLAEMSSAGNLMDGAYVTECVKNARNNAGFVMGFIAQRSLNELPTDNFVTMTPGVQIGAKGDSLGQQYNTPERVIKDAGADVIIVGRGVYGAQDRAKAAEEYRIRGWKAYEDRIGKRM